MRSKFIWITFFACLSEIGPFSKGRQSRTKPELRNPRSAVYFPALVDDAYLQELGLSGVDHEGRGRIVGGSFLYHRNSPPLMLPKPTTTTEKLPLAQHSYVANHSVTEAPGPSYLTETIYFYGDATPAPEYSAGHDHQYNNKHEDERAGVNWQSLLHTPQSLGEQLDPLLNQALMYYIPSNPLDTIEQLITKSTIGSEEAPRTTTESSAVSNNFYEQSVTPETITVKTSPLTSSPSSFRRRPDSAHRIRFRPRPITSRMHVPSPNVTERPKAVVNPFEARISRPVVPPVYQRATTEKSPITSAIPEQRRKLIEQERTISPDSISLKGSFGQRQPTTKKTEEVYRPPEAENSEEFFQQEPHDFGFDFNSPSEYRSSSGRKFPRPEEESPVYRTSTLSFRAPSSLHRIRPLPEKNVNDPSSHRDFVQADPNIYVPQEYSTEAIPGNAGIDYPIYSRVPDTTFRCSDQAYPGLYADEDAQCQVFYICQEGGREDSFLCPNGTVFNQQYFVCDWWYNFSCDQADRFFSLNAFLYKVPEDRTRGRSFYS